MFCPQCGNRLPDSAKFCPGCGTPVRQIQRPEPVNPVPDPGQSPVQPLSEQQFRPPLAGEPIPDPAPLRPDPVQEPSPLRPDPVQEPSPLRPDPLQEPSPLRPDPVQNPVYVQRDPAADLRPQRPDRTPTQETVVRTSPSGGKRFLAFLLCLLLLIAGLGASQLGSLRWAFDPDALYYRILEMDLSQSTMPDEHGEAIPLAQFIQKVCQIDFQEEYGIDETGLNRLLNADFLKRFIADNLANYTDTLLRGVPLKPLTREKLVDFLRANDKEMKRLTGFSFVEYEYEGQLDRIDEYLDVYSLDGIFDELGTRSIDEDFFRNNLGLNLDLWKVVFSLWVLLALCGVCLLLLILIFAVFRQYPARAFGHSGTTLLILGLLDLILGAVGLAALKIAKLGTVELLVGPMLIALLVIGGAALLIGIIFLIIRGARRRKEAGQTA